MSTKNENNSVVHVQSHPFKPYEVKPGKPGDRIADILNYPEVAENLEVTQNGKVLGDGNYVLQGDETVVVRNIAAEPTTAIVAAITVVSAIASFFIVRNLLGNLDRPGKSFSITGQSNKLRPYGPVQSVLGTRRVTPQLAAKPWLIEQDDESYIRALYLFGYGPLELSDFQIGETPISQFTDADGNAPEMEIFDLWDNFDDITIFPSDVSQTKVDVDMEPRTATETPTPFVTRTTQQVTKEISVTINYKRGLYYATDQNKTKTTTSSVAVQIRSRKTGVGFYTLILDRYTPELTEGFPFARLGFYKLYHGSVFRWVPDTGSSKLYVVNTDSNSSVGPTHKDVAIPHNQSGIDDLVANNVLYELQEEVAVDGRFGPGSLVTAVHNPKYHAIGTFSHNDITHYLGMLKNKTRTPFRVSAGFDFSSNVLAEFGEDPDDDLNQLYEVRCRQVDFANPNDEDENNKVINTATFDRLTSIDKTRPPVELNGVVLVALNIRAHEQLNGQIDNFNAVAKSVVPNWDQPNWNQFDTGGVTPFKGNDFDTFKAAIGENKYTISKANGHTTQNPAELMRWVLQGPMNSQKLPDSRIDLDQLGDFRDFCDEIHDATDEPVFRCNAEIDYETTLFELLNDVASTGRAQFGFRDGLYSVIYDHEQLAPVQIFGDQDVVEAVSEREFLPDIDGFTVQFQNEEKRYEKDEFPLLNPNKKGDSGQFRNDFETIDLWGVTNPVQAYDMAKFRMLARTLRRESFKISTDVTALKCRAGDWIRLQNKILLIGLGAARVTAVSGSTITLDENFTFSSSSSYGIEVRPKTGSIPVGSSPIVNPGDTETNELEVSSGTIPAVGDMVVVGTAGNESIDLVVAEIDFDTDLNAEIKAVSYNTDLYDLVDEIPKFDSGISVPVNATDLPPPDITGVSLVDQRARDARGNIYSTVNVLISYPASNILSGSEVEVEYQNIETSDSFTSVGVFPSGTPRVEIKDLPLGTYNFRARLRKEEAQSPYDTFQFKLRKDEGFIPGVPNVRGLEVINGTEVGEQWEFAGRDIKLRWKLNSLTEFFDFGSEPNGGDSGALDEYFEDYFIQVVNPDTGKVVREEVVGANNWIYTYEMNAEDNGTAIRTVQFKVRVRGAENQISKIAEQLRATNPAPTFSEGPTFTADNTTLKISFPEPTDLDFKSVQVYISQTPGFTPTESELVYDGVHTKPIVVTDLAKNTTYYVVFTFTDAFGVGPNSSEFTFSTGGILGEDVTPPTDPTGLAVTSTIQEAKLYTTASVTATWNASTDDSGAVYYDVEYWFTDAPSDITFDIATSPNYTIFPAEAGREYAFRVRASDYSGNKSGYTLTETHTVVGDTVPPAAASNVTATGGLKKITVRWENPTDSDFLQVEVHRSTTSGFTPGPTTLQTRSRGESYVDVDVVDETTYYYKIVSLDVSDNVGAASPEASGIPFKIKSTNVSEYIDPLTIEADKFASGIEPVSIVSSLPNPVGYSGPNTVLLTTDKKLYRYDSSVPEFTPEVDGADVVANSILAGSISTGALSAMVVRGDVIRTADSGQRVQLDNVNGITTFNTNGDNTVQINTDGSGFLGLNGGSGSITWNNTGTVTVPGTLIASGIDAANITTGFLDANRIQSNTIDADKLFVLELSAITANLGSITAGTITGALIRTASSGQRVQFDSTNGIQAINSSGATTAQIDTDGSGFIGKDSLGNPILEIGASSGLTISKKVSVLGTGAEIVVDNSGSIHSVGKDSFQDISAGFFLGYDSGQAAYTIDIGDSSNYLRYNGTNLTIETSNFSVDSGGNVSVTGSIESGSTITGATITGGTIRTNDTTTRVEMTESPNAIRIYESGTVVFEGTGESLSASGFSTYCASGDPNDTNGTRNGFVGQSGGGSGVVGISSSNNGVFGRSATGDGVHGEVTSSGGNGVLGQGVTGSPGVLGTNTGSGVGVQCNSTSGIPLLIGGLGSAPTGSGGGVYYNFNTGTLHYYNGSVWKEIATV